MLKGRYWLVTIFLAACLDAPPGSSDKGPTDGGARDGALLDGAWRDGASLDGASLDGASLDGASFDADPAAQAACMEAFGEISGYTLCATDGIVCEFYVEVEPSASCADLCNGLGHECVQSYDSSGDMICSREEPEQCIQAHGTQICVCEL